MPLPQIAAPVFELIQPSTGETLQYRPFLVKEEKILLIAKESGEKSDIHNAIKQIVNNCVINENFDVNDVPIFDMEYIFINIRSKSVSNIVQFKVEDSSDQMEYELELNLDDVKVITNDKHEKKIAINDTVGLVMKYPKPTIEEKIKNLKTMIEVSLETVMECVDYVYDEDSVYKWAGVSNKEKQEFLDALDRKSFVKITEFFATMPKIEHIVTYKNSKGEEKQVIFRNLEDFFMLD